MKKTFGLILGIMVMASTAFATKSEGEKVTFEIDTKESKVFWTGKKVTGMHTGYVSVGSGTVSVEGNNVTGADVEMDLNTIVCTDLQNEELNQKLVGHLKSDDFFSVEKYPLASFEITSIEASSDLGYSVTGNLTMKGITHEISFPAEINLKNGVVNASGTVSVDRTKWNIKYGSGSFFKGLGDRMINDEFEITFNLLAKADDLN